jgi:hypothetical protein
MCPKAQSTLHGWSGFSKIQANTTIPFQWITIGMKKGSIGRLARLRFSKGYLD